MVMRVILRLVDRDVSLIMALTFNVPDQCILLPSQTNAQAQHFRFTDCGSKAKYKRNSKTTGEPAREQESSLNYDHTGTAGLKYHLDSNTLEVLIPIKLIRRGGHTHIWLQQLAAGEYDEVVITSSYVSRILRLTLLSPHIQETILTRKSLSARTLADFMDGFSLVWHEQIVRWNALHIRLNHF